MDNAKVIAEKWFSGLYNEELARVAARVDYVDFDEVSREYGRLYEEMERLSHG